MVTCSFGFDYEFHGAGLKEELRDVKKSKNKTFCEVLF